MSGMDFEMQDPPSYESGSTELERNEQTFKSQIGLHQEYPPAYETVANNQLHPMTDIRPQPTLPSPTDSQMSGVTVVRQQPTVNPTNNQWYPMTDIRPQPTLPSPTDTQMSGVTVVRQQPTVNPTNNQWYPMTDIRPQPTLPSPTDTQMSGVTIVGQQPTVTPTVETEDTEDYLRLSKLVTISVFLFGGWLFLLCSVAAICFSKSARDDKRHGSFASAQKKSKISLRLNIVAISMTFGTWVTIGSLLGNGTFSNSQDLQTTNTSHITTSGPPATSRTTSTATPRNYFNGCSSVTLSGTVLSAICRNNAGSSGNSQIDLNNYIVNIDGVFTWGMRDFAASCYSIQLQGTTLSGSCQRIDGSTADTSINLNERISNNNGRLVYN